MKIATWLRQFGLETYGPALRDNHIDVDALKTLEAPDPEGMGVTSLADRKLLLETIVRPRDRWRRARGGTSLRTGDRLRQPAPPPVDGAGLLRLPVPLCRPPEVPARERPMPLLGREQELGLLLRAWRRARSGAGHVVLMPGAPGIGKSRLLRALCERLAGTPHAHLDHRCSSDHVHSALHPILALLPEVDPEPPELPVRLPPGRRRQETFATLLGQLEGLAARQPVLAVYEDLHWADASTLEFLDLVIDRVPHLPVLAVMTFRPGFAVPWEDRRHTTCLPLAPLSQAGTWAMVDHLTRGAPLHEPLVEAILHAAEGVPLMLEELTRAVLEAGPAGAAQEADGGAPPVVPSSLPDALMTRLERMPQVADLARIAAALGREFTFELLQAVAERQQGELLDAMDRLVASNLVIFRSAPSGTAYAFRHAMIQDALCESTPASLRRRLHARIARTLEERASGLDAAGLEPLAQHYALAGLIEDAIRCRLRAATAARGRSALTEAIGHLCRGLELLDGLPAAPAYRFERLSLLAALGETLALASGGAAAGVGQALDLARRLCLEVDETPELFPIARGLCDHHLTLADHAGARELAAQCGRLAASTPEPGRLIDAHFCQGASALFVGELAQAHEHLTRSAVLHDVQRGGARPLATHPRAFALAHLAQTLWLRGFPDQATGVALEAVTAARDAGQPFALAYALLGAGLLHQLLRQPATTRAMAAEAIDRAAEEELPAFHAMATILHAWSLPEPPAPARMQERSRATGQPGRSWRGLFCWGFFPMYRPAPATSRTASRRCPGGWRRAAARASAGTSPSCAGRKATSCSGARSPTAGWPAPASARR
jgi:hypothetical protein